MALVSIAGLSSCLLKFIYYDNIIAYINYNMSQGEGRLGGASERIKVFWNAATIMGGHVAYYHARDLFVPA